MAATAGPTGQGSRAIDSSIDFSQGSILATNQPLDLAIEGDGFFVMRSSRTTNAKSKSPSKVGSPSSLSRIAEEYAGSDSLFENDYVRTRSLRIDSSGYVVDSDGRRLKTGLGTSGQVFTKFDPLESATVEPGWINAESDYVRIPENIGSGKVTTKIRIAGNFGNRDIPVDQAKPFSPTDDTTYSFSSGLTIYGDSGVPQSAQVYYRKKTAALAPDRSSNWDVFLVVEGSQYKSELPEIAFDSNGSLTGANREIKFTLSGETVIPPSVPVRSNPFDKTPLPPPSPSKTVKFQRDIVVQFDPVTVRSNRPDSKIGLQTQDGYQPGVIDQLSVDRYGTLKAGLTNGRSETIAQIKLVRFLNNSGLRQVGDGVYKPTTDSGEPVEGIAGKNGFGAVAGSALEQSNTDLVSELTLIVESQLTFSANGSAVDKQSAMVRSLLEKI
jgi:flagellar hook protein FlgE